MIAGREQDQRLARRQRSARAAHDGARLQPRACGPRAANPRRAGVACPAGAAGEAGGGPGGSGRTADAGPGGRGRRQVAQALPQILAVIAAHRLVADGVRELVDARFEAGAALRRVERARPPFPGAHSTSASGRAPARTSAIAPGPPERTRSSGS